MCIILYLFLFVKKSN
ncbi:hypothetical protein PFMALIP_04875 [Plasmodium falciparum MaliPS096_E11]|uniref:Uncharacterized protein n=1 Tax=Plasmodium falciparum MaliPS096_E11 TaxID=1036727 RepID=A0A024WJA1_PLAFA|nr:hypothetical protein PFMALIP_04875 [Plasmodium falciparum MaliPS096_E11]